MIKIENYILDQECLEIYGEQQIFLPEDFAEYFRHKDLIEEIYKTHDRLLPSLYQIILGNYLRENDEAPPNPLQAPPKDPTRERRTTPVSREDIMWGNNVIKALNQVPYEAMVGVLGRTLMSSDPVAGRYIGEGLSGALKHREKPGQPLSNYTCEMRYVKTGKPAMRIFDPHTKMPVPNIGAVLSPGRIETISKFANEACPNPHQGYLYDGKDDDGKILYNGPGGDRPNLNNAQNMAKGVYLPYRALTSQIETPVGKPMRFYSPNEDPTKKIPMKKVGTVGASLAPPVPGQPNSYTHELDDQGNWVLSQNPMALGYSARASVAGRHRTHGLDDSDDKGNTAETFDKQKRKWLQAQAENPAAFNQRLARFMQYRAQKAQESPSFEDREKNVITRTPSNMPLVPPETQRFTHAPRLDAFGQVRKRERRVEVPGAPSRKQVEPALRVPLNPEREKAFRDYQTGDPAYYKSQIDHYNSIGRSDIANKLQKDFEKKSSDGSFELQQKVFAARDVARTKQVAKKGDFGQGIVQVGTGEFDSEGNEIFKPKQEIRRDSKGREVTRDVKHKHMLPITKRIIPNLYSLMPALDPKKPLLISEALAQEIMEAEKRKVPTSRIKLTQGDKGSNYPEISDEVVRHNYGTRRLADEKSQKASGEDIRAMTFVIDKKVGNRYLVRIKTNDANGKNPCYFAMTDQHGEVMFRYEKNIEEQEQPVLSPGIINHAMKNNRTLLGGHNAAPAGEGEAIPYETDQRHNTSLHGRQNPDGTWNIGPQKATKKATKKLGWASTIESQTSYGVRFYLSKELGDLSEETKERLRSEKSISEFNSVARIYCYNNLKNGKFLDINEGRDVYFNLRYMHHLFPHLYAVIRQLDRLVGTKAKTPEEIELKEKLWSVGTRLPSQMTLTEFKGWLNNPIVRNVLDESPRNVRVKTSRLTTRSKKHPSGYNYKKAYDPEMHLYQRDENGKELENPEDIKGARKGWTGLIVTVPQIWQMVNDARIWYCRYIGKDVVRKVVKQETSLIGKKINKGDTFAADGTSLSLDKATNDSIAARRAEGDLKSGKGYSKYRGKFQQLIAERRFAPVLLRRELDAAREEFNAKPSFETAAKCARIASWLGVAQVEVLAYQRLEEKIDMMKKKQRPNPDLNQPWTDENTQVYVVRHMPEFIKQVQQDRNENHVNQEHLSAAGDNAELDKHEMPNDILDKAEREMGELSKPIKDIAEQVGFWISTDDEETSPEELEKAKKFIYALDNDKLLDINRPLVDINKGTDIPSNELSKQIEAAVSYYAIKTLSVAISDNQYNDDTISKLRSLVSELNHVGLVPYYTHAAKILFSLHHINGGKKP